MSFECVQFRDVIVFEVQLQKTRALECTELSDFLIMLKIKNLQIFKEDLIFFLLEHGL